MTQPDQASLFETQGNLFVEEPPQPAYRPDPEKVRARLRKIIGEARAAAEMPWEPSQLSLYRTIVPQMTLWLPEDEAAQWRLEFEEELARFEAT